MKLYLVNLRDESPTLTKFRIKKLYPNLRTTFLYASQGKPACPNSLLPKSWTLIKPNFHLKSVHINSQFNPADVEGHQFFKFISTPNVRGDYRILIEWCHALFSQMNGIVPLIKFMVRPTIYVWRGVQH